MKNSQAILALLTIFIPLSISARGHSRFTGSLLWKISGNGLEKPSYILGTHHLATRGFAQQIPGLTEALDSCSHVVGEISLTDMERSEEALAEHIHLPEGITYHDLMTPEEMEAVDRGLKEITGSGLDKMFGRYHPAALSMIYASAVTAAALPGEAGNRETGIDQYVQEYALATGKAVSGLETPEDQIRALFYSEPIEAHARALVCMISTAEHHKHAARRLFDLYKEGNLFEIYGQAFGDDDDPCRMSDELQVAINNTRNEAWLQKLPGIMAASPTLIAVGALHLTGSEGLLAGLDKLGYSVEAVVE